MFSYRIAAFFLLLILLLQAVENEAASFLGPAPASVECAGRFASQQKCSLDLWAAAKASCAVFLIFYEEGRSDLYLQKRSHAERCSMC